MARREVALRRERGPAAETVTAAMAQTRLCERSEAMTVAVRSPSPWAP